jgi:hypothetical protein
MSRTKTAEPKIAEVISVPSYVEDDKQDAISILENAIERIKSGEADAVIVGLLLSRRVTGGDSITADFSTGCYGRLYKAMACADMAKDMLKREMEDG